METNLHVGAVVEYIGDETLPSATGTIVSILPDKAGLKSRDAYIVNLGAKVLGIFRASQLTCVKPALDGLIFATTLQQ